MGQKSIFIGSTFPFCILNLMRAVLPSPTTCWWSDGVLIWRVNRNTHERFTNAFGTMTFRIRSLARTRFSDFFQHMTGNLSNDANAVEQVSRTQQWKKINISYDKAKIRRHIESEVSGVKLCSVQRKFCRFSIKFYFWNLQLLNKQLTIINLCSWLYVCECVLKHICFVSIQARIVIKLVWLLSSSFMHMSISVWTAACTWRCGLLKKCSSRVIFGWSIDIIN